MSGKLYGVGVGPGDPELMTLKAQRIITSVRVLAYPKLTGVDSFARAIAARFIAPNTREIAVVIPMTVDRAPAQAAYDGGARALAKELRRGADVAVLCEGDPFFYGSFMYLFSRLAGEFETEVVPGVTSITACAAVAGRPLAARNEVLTVIPGTLNETDMTARIEVAQAVAIMKVGRHLAKIRGVLDRLNLTRYARYIERATLPDEVVLPLADTPDTAPYFSMILITKGNDPWL